MLPETLTWKDGELVLIDQRAIPWEVRYERCRNAEEVATAIEKMVVRGAPAIGCAAAYGVVLAALSGRNEAMRALDRLAATRPTAVNLFWALERMRRCLQEEISGGDGQRLVQRLLDAASRIHEADLADNRAMGYFGQELLPRDCRAVTHCNAGALATAGFGTALGVFRAAREAGKNVRIFADETRPRLQGGRLTAWELLKDGFDVTVICDGMAAALMSRSRVDAVIVGADRIAANGDVANKIGTFQLALAARYHQVPFYVAAPLSTVDPELPDGTGIPIEERSPDEVRSPGGVPLLPESFPVWNPAFDVTPAELLSAIITEKGVLRAPYGPALDAVFSAANRERGE